MKQTFFIFPLCGLLKVAPWPLIEIKLDIGTIRSGWLKVTAVGRLFYESLTLNSAGTFFTDRKSEGGRCSEVTVIRGSTVFPFFLIKRVTWFYNSWASKEASNFLRDNFFSFLLLLLFRFFKAILVNVP